MAESTITTETAFADTIFNEDCIAGLERVPDGCVDLVVADPPYGVLNKGNEAVKWDKPPDLAALWVQLERVSKPETAFVFFGSGMFSADLMKSNPSAWKYNLVWEKTVPTGFLNASRQPLRSHEDIVVFYRKPPVYNPQMWEGPPNHSRGKTKERRTTRLYGKITHESDDDLSGVKYPRSILSFPSEKKCAHPTQKPIELIRYLVRTYSNPGALVLDPFMGSGTTAVACVDEGRHFVGFETNSEYHSTACARVEAERIVGRLF